ncbi:MAG: hypothetical protein C0618_06535 [Desulfuromonas sp.]|nr:MAG: hypothetical protein C0618_06535 [Desulfuromonas sp.]
MNKKILGVMLVLLMVPMGLMAMSHGDHGKGAAMDHGKMDNGKMDHGKMDHGGGMGMGGDMIMLQDEEINGVMGSAHMMDVRAKMAEHGMTMTHHLMVSFMNTEGEPLTKGTVAVKVEAPDGTVSKPIMMMGMSGAFGADITLDQPGMYHFKIGTKLADGEKRTFHFHHQN